MHNVEMEELIGWRYTYRGVEQAPGDQCADEEEKDKGEKSVGFSWRLDELPPDRVCEMTRVPRPMHVARLPLQHV